MRNRTRRQVYAIRAAGAVVAAAGWTLAGILYFKAPPAPVVAPGETVELPPAEVTVPAVPDEPFANVREIVVQMREAPEFSAVQIGFCLLGTSGETLVGEGESTALVPASALKTVTVATALESLGEHFRFETNLLATAPVRDGVLEGDLVLAGGGDPTLERGDLTTFAADLARRGIKKVTGSVIADARHFPPASGAPVSDHWGWGDIGNAYGAAPYGLNLGHNTFTVFFTPGAEVGAPAAIASTEPDVPGVVFTNAVTTGEAGSGDGVVIYSAPYARRVELRGTVPLGEPGFDVGGAVPDPPLAAAIALRDALQKSGVTVDGIPTTDRLLVIGGGSVPPAPISLAVHRSPALPDIARHLLDVSDNLEAECLFRSLGADTGIPPAAFLRDHWAARGVPMTGLRMEDGSGLARANQIRTADLARSNFLALSGPAGETYSTLLKRSAGGRVYSKSGAMSGVRSHTGFLAPARGAAPTHTFALIVNGFTASPSDVATWRDRLLREILAEIDE